MSVGDLEAINADDFETPSKDPRNAASLAMPLQADDDGHVIRVHSLSYCFGQGIFQCFPEEYVTESGANPDTALHQAAHSLDLGVEYMELHMFKRIWLQDIESIHVPPGFVNKVRGVISALPGRPPRVRVASTF